MSQLAAHFLGTLTVLRDGRALHGFESIKSRALLVYLILESAKSHSRTHLATLLWPDLPLSRARHNLRQALSNLRRVLGGKEAASAFLDISRSSIQFKQGPHVYVDVFDFLHHLDQSAHDQEAAISSLERAIELYRGDLLPGFTVPGCDIFEEWLREWREHLHSRALSALRRLIDYYQEEPLYDRALAYTRRLLQMVPWDEEVHRRMMWLLALTGQRALAIAQYHHCKRILAEEFGVSPSAETEELYEQIRSGALGTLSLAASQAPSTQGRVRGALPFFVTPFVGREKEMTLIAERLYDPSCRLVTIVGMGGIGKSRLAVEVAQTFASRFRDGVAFVSLISVVSPSQVPQAIADVLGLPRKEKEAIQTRVLEYLADREMLLIFDNFEHVQPARSFLLDILEKAPRVKILVTSRERLRLLKEWVVPLMGLTYPADEESDDLEQYDAIRLFVESAQRVRPMFSLTPDVRPAVVRICQYVQGSPLAIQLATSWLQTLSCQDVATAIARGMDILVTTVPDVPERHRSMRVVFEHTWGMLSEEERRAFRQLCVFQEMFTAEAARDVARASLTLLAQLAHKSLLSVSERGHYTIHPLLRRFGRERLEDRPQEQQEVWQRYVAYVLHVLQQQGQRLRSPGQRAALQAIADLLPDVRVVWRWLSQQRDMGGIVQMIDPLRLFYEIRARWEEAHDLFGEAAQSFYPPQNEQEECVMGRLTLWQGWFALRLSRLEEARLLLEKASKHLDVCSTVRDRAFLLRAQGILHKELADYKKAITLIEESVRLFENAGEPGEVAASLLPLCGALEAAGGDPKRIQMLGEEALALFRSLGDPRGIAQALSNLGNVFFLQGKYQRARQDWEESLNIRQALGDTLGLAVNITNLANIALIERDYEEARRLLQKAADLYHAIGSKFSWAFNMLNLGIVAEAEHDLESALRYYLLSRNVLEQVGHRWGLVVNQCFLADVYVELDHLDEAIRLLQSALQMARESGSEFLNLRTLISVGHYFLHTGQEGTARDVLAFVYRHPRSNSELRLRIEHLLTHPSSQPSPFTLADLEEHEISMCPDALFQCVAQALGALESRPPFNEGQDTAEDGPAR